MAGAAGQGEKLRVFIGYSRDDIAFADQLFVVLQAYGFDLAIDRESISAGEDWKQRLSLLIRDADTIVFVLSPSSVRSEIFNWEVEEAIRLGKRIIPVLCRPLNGADPSNEIARLNYVYFYEEPKLPGSGFGAGLADLVGALTTDPGWLREHTRYMRLAKEWEEFGKPSDRQLLSAPDIALARQWIASRPKNSPEPTSLQLDFINASEVEELHRQFDSGRAGALAEREAIIAEREEALRRREAEADRLRQGTDADAEIRGPTPTEAPSTLAQIPDTTELVSSGHAEDPPLKIFISYSHDDERMRKRLGQHLAGLESEGVIRIWYDRQIEPAADWEGTINREILEADAILLLVSASFISSKYCREELRKALVDRI